MTRLAILIAALLSQVASAQIPYPPPVTSADIATIVSAVSPSFVAGGAYIPTASLLSVYPCSATYLGRYGRVNDMWGSVSTVTVCEYDSLLGYYWRPQRTDYAGNISQTTGTINLVPLVTPPVIYMTAAPTSTMTITFSTTNVWPGASFHIYAPATIPTLVSVNLSGLVGGGTVPLIQGSDKVVTYTPAGWKSN